VTDRHLWVVKLGGSLVRSDLLKSWLAALVEGGGRLVVVAGGGPFADAVRAAQSLHGFDDATAHRMALLAMEQYATMLAGLGNEMGTVPIFPAASLDEIRRALADDLVPIWLPARRVLDCASIDASWDVTSDSLAAWLAGHLGASALVLVKAVSSGAPRAADALARDGIVDRAFPDYLSNCGCECRIVGAAEHAVFGRAMRDGEPPGMPVLPRQGNISAFGRRRL
jgi:dihydroneopterin aldolase